MPPRTVAWSKEIALEALPRGRKSARQCVWGLTAGKQRFDPLQRTPPLIQSMPWHLWGRGRAKNIRRGRAESALSRRRSPRMAVSHAAVRWPVALRTSQTSPG